MERCFFILILIPFVSSQCPFPDEYSLSCECAPMEGTRFLTVTCKKMNELKIEDILCCNSTVEDIELSVDFKDIGQLVTVGSKLLNFDFKMLENMTNLRVLNLSHSFIHHVEWDNCQLHSLEVLDLSHNEVENVTKGFFLCNQNIKELGLHGNKLRCENFSWFIDWVRDAQDRGMQIYNKHEWLCYVIVKKPKEELSELALAHIVDTCPRNCSCLLTDDDRIKVEVDCSNRGWYDFPERIPIQTRILYLSNNKIRSFRKFRSGFNYEQVIRIALDNNSITSLADLEGIQPYYRFSSMYLNGNKLTQLPLHIMEKLQGEFKLGGNPWQCDCIYGTALRNYIIDQVKRIMDISNITCSPDDKRHPNRAVMHLSQIDLCYPEEDAFHILDVVNGVLATLIVVVLAKLVYDWWHFKHTGQLPLGPVAIIQLWKKKRFRMNSLDT